LYHIVVQREFIGIGFLLLCWLLLVVG